MSLAVDAGVAGRFHVSRGQAAPAIDSFQALTCSKTLSDAERIQMDVIFLIGKSDDDPSVRIVLAQADL